MKCTDEAKSFVRSLSSALARRGEWQGPLWGPHTHNLLMDEDMIFWLNSHGATSLNYKPHSIGNQNSSHINRSTQALMTAVALHLLCIHSTRPHIVSRGFGQGELVEHSTRILPASRTGQGASATEDLGGFCWATLARVGSTLVEDWEQIELVSLGPRASPRRGVFPR